MKGVIHWVSVKSGIAAEIRIYNPLFNQTDPTKAESLTEAINPESEVILKNCVVEAALQEAEPETHFQFERIGYFVTDRHDHSSANPVLNRTVTLRDTWAK